MKFSIQIQCSCSQKIYCLNFCYMVILLEKIKGGISMPQDMSARIIGLLQGVNSLLIIICLIVGSLYMIKSKKSKASRIIIGAVIILIPFVIMIVLNIAKLKSLENKYNNTITNAAMTSDVVINGKTITLPYDYDEFLNDTGFEIYDVGVRLPSNQAWVTDGHSYIELGKNWDDDVNKISITRNNFDAIKTNITFTNGISFSSNLSDVKDKLGNGDGGQKTNYPNVANGGLYNRYTFRNSEMMFVIGADDNGKILLIEISSFLYNSDEL